jgi:folate-binding protein YgfZ
MADAPDDYVALRERAGLVALPWLDRLTVVGSDRVDFLQGMLSNDVKKLAVGAGCPALLLSEQGKVVADLMVLATEDAIALDGMASALADAKAALERFVVADDVEIGPAPDAPRAFGLFGPEVAATLTRLAIAVPDVPYAHVRGTSGGIACHVVRVPGPGAGGVICWVAQDAASVWLGHCRDVGGVPVASREAFDVLRIESGMPWHGRDVTADTLALEAPYDLAVSFKKGCYLGQEVMERVTARGHVNRKLVGLAMAADVVPDPGTHLFAADRDVGWVTSAARSWRLGHAVALGYVRREHLAPGTVLTLGAGGPPVTVRALPF